MHMNPMLLLQAKERIDIFGQEHPKVFPFFKMLKNKALHVGAVYEMKVTSADGQEYVSNIRLTENDVQTIGMIMEAISQENPQ